MESNETTQKILCVDDEERIVNGLKRHLGMDYNVYTASNGQQALELFRKEGPFPVVISDLQMPVMDGISFLKSIKETWPDSIRIMLTGKADLMDAVEAVNKGNIYRFLTKPATIDGLKMAVKDGLELHRLKRIEREMMEQTVRGSIRILTDVLSLSHPDAFGAAQRIKRLARDVAIAMNYPELWEVEIAALLSKVGLVAVPEDVLKKVRAGIPLNKEEQAVFTEHPVIARRLVKNIPRLEEIASIIAHQNDEYAARKADNDVPPAARILKVCVDFDHFSQQKGGALKALEIMRTKYAGRYDPDAFAILQKVIEGQDTYRKTAVMVDDLKTNMIIAEDVKGNSGITLIAKGQEASMSLISRLQSYSRTAGVVEPIQVYILNE